MKNIYSKHFYFDFLQADIFLTLNSTLQFLLPEPTVRQQVTDSLVENNFDGLICL